MCLWSVGWRQGGGRQYRNCKAGINGVDTRVRPVATMAIVTQAGSRRRPPPPLELTEGHGSESSPLLYAMRGSPMSLCFKILGWLAHAPGATSMTSRTRVLSMVWAPGYGVCNEEGGGRGEESNSPNVREHGEGTYGC